MGSGSRAAEAAIDIDAPIETVWRVMLDLHAYPEWNPFIVRVLRAPASIEVGSRFELCVRWADGGEARSAEIVTCADAPAASEPGRRTARFAYRFTGPLHSLHLVRAVRVQDLEQLPGQPTRYHTREEFHGLFKAALPMRNIQDGFERHARALKARAESFAGSGPR
jgi:uncharacterized protein YndB with AHSA1/START domain